MPRKNDRSAPFDRWRSWRHAGAERLGELIDRRRSTSTPLDLALTYYERDRELLTSILGSAIALRLFLFIVPLLAFVISMIRLVIGENGLNLLLEQASIAGQLAQEVSRGTSTSTLVLTALTAAMLSIWAGRNLVLVLAACSGTAWRLSVNERRASLRANATVTLLVIGLVLAASIVNRLRSEFTGVAGGMTSWLLAIGVATVSWFAVMWALPSRTRDPGAVLPGAIVVGVALAVFQWFMQFYLPSRLARSSSLVGGVGTTVATLGVLFLVGRLMASSFVLNAVVYERFGSLSTRLFGLPILRALPRRSPRLAAWFDVPTAPGDEGRTTSEASPRTSPSTASSRRTENGVDGVEHTIASRDVGVDHTGRVVDDEAVGRPDEGERSARC